MWTEFIVGSMDMKWMDIRAMTSKQAISLLQEQKLIEIVINCNYFIFIIYLHDVWILTREQVGQFLVSSLIEYNLI